LVKTVQEIMGEDYEITSITTNKINARKRVGISMLMLGSTMSPIIYVDDIIEAIEKSEISIKDAAKQIVDVNSKIISNEVLSNQDKISEIADKEYILNHVEYQLINAEQNIEMLKNVPNKRVLDLAVIYRVVCVDSSDDGMCSYVFENKHLEQTNISIEELDEAALRNTKEAGLVIKEFPEILADAIPMYILTNPRKVNGAVVLLFNDFLAEVAEKLGGDIYLIPSSINELIAIPVSVIPPEDLKNMIKNVNDTDVPDDEILSYSVYKFNVLTGEVEIAG
jgi:hypothetical protein